MVVVSGEVEAGNVAVVGLIARTVGLLYEVLNEGEVPVFDGCEEGRVALLVPHSQIKTY